MPIYAGELFVRYKRVDKKQLCRMRDLFVLETLLEEIIERPSCMLLMLQS